MRSASKMSKISYTSSLLVFLGIENIEKALLFHVQRYSLSVFLSN